MGRPLRLLLPLLAAGLVGAGYAIPRQDAKVSYTTKAKRADLVLEEIATLTGRTIETSPDAKLHYLVVSVTDVDPNQLLEQIATVTSSKWNVAGNRWILMVDDLARRKEQDARNAKRVKRFKEALEEIRKELAKKPDPDPEDENYSWPMFESPGEKALAQLSLLIDPNEVAKLEEDSRVVFSTVPNRMQRGMNSNQVSGILANLAKEHNEYAAEQIKSNEEMKRMMQESGEDMDFGWFQEQYHLFETPPAKALVILQLDGAEYGYAGQDANAKLIVYDQKGKAVVNATISFTPEMYDDSRYPQFDPETGEMIEEEEEKDVKPISEEDRTPITLSEDSKKFSAISSGEEFNFRLPEPVLELLRDPVSKDPLSFHSSDALHSVAKVKKLNVVANLADSEGEAGMGMIFMGEEGAMTVGMAVSQYTEGEEPSGTIKDGWFVIKPADPIAARKNRQDRQVLKGFIDRTVAEGRASLDNLAAFALASPMPMVNGVSMMYIVAFSPSMLQGLMGDTMDWNMLKFYGSLTPPQKTSLSQGGKVPFANLTQQARAIAQKMAFSSSANIKTGEKMKEESNMPFFLAMMGDMMGQNTKTAIEEPTELMPNGLPPEGWVELATSNESTISADSGSNIFFLGMGNMGAGEIAFMEVLREFSESRGESEDYFQLPETVRMASRDRLKFDFWLSPAAGMSKTLLDDKVDKDAKPVSFANIPPAFRAEIDKRKKEIKDSPYGRLLGGIGLHG